ncbi:molybdenum cofactor guanylyltransferase [Phycisphaeraceae bacterium D3-23]
MPPTQPPESDSLRNDAPPAYILAGGRSVRFGSDKARAVVEGQTLIAHVAHAVSQVARSVTAVAQDAGHYADLGLATIADAAADNGPVQGLLAALIHRIETHGHGWLLLAACDMLVADDSPYNTLLAALQVVPKDCQVVAFRTDRWHPMPGLYHTAMLPIVAAFLADGGRAFQDLLNHPALAAFAPHTQTDPLAKLVHANTPDQLRTGLRQRDDPTQTNPADPT